MTDEVLTRSAASNAVEEVGWRYLLGTVMTSVPMPSLSEATEVATAVVRVCGAVADRHLRLDVRADRLELSLQTRALGGVTSRDVELAERITDHLRTGGYRPGAAGSSDPPRPVQMLEIAVDALDIARIRPFWRAVLGYFDEPGAGPLDAIVDPVGQLPAVWFQQMDSPRPQRNRIHLDITVAHDEAPARVEAALAAEGTLVSSAAARAFWILADAEGNEVCVCTWLDRDGRDSSG